MMSSESEALDAYSQGVSQAAARVGPALVRIDVSGRQTEAHGRRRQARAGLGSGVIYASDGHILTNAHVVRGADRIQVTLADRRSFPAGVLERDDAVDLAVVRVGSTGLPVAELSRRPLQVGQLVVAVGTAFGLGWTVTAGVVSALNRRLENGPPGLTNLVQTDTPINPGNSGGPLVDVRGRVVGINVAVLPYAHGIGFAIPTETVLSTLARVGAASGPTDGIWFGIGGITSAIDPAVVRDQKLPSNKGLLVLEVHPDSPAAAASFKPMDMIVTVAGHDVAGIQDLARVVSAVGMGRAIEVMFLRENRRRKVAVVLGHGTPAAPG